MDDRQKILKCSCANCGGYIEFPAQAVGQTVECPHCQEPVELQPVEPEEKSSAPLLAIMAVIFLIIAITSAYLSKRHERKTPPAPSVITAGSKPSDVVPSDEQAEPVQQSAHDLKQGKVKLERIKESSLIYAMGNIKNDSPQQKFSIKVTVAVFDKDGNNIGAAGDYKAVLEAHETWTFRALVTEPNAATAKITQITEQ